MNFKTFCCTVEDRFGESCTVFGTYYWYEDDGKRLDSFDFWPYDRDIEESVLDWILEDL